MDSWLSSLNMSLENPQAPAVLENVLQQQSAMIGFLDTFYFVMWCFIIIAPLILFIKTVKALKAGFAE